MTEQEITNQILEQIKKTGPISSVAKAKGLAKRLAVAMVITNKKDQIVVKSDPIPEPPKLPESFLRSRPKRKLGESSEFTSEDS